MATVQPLIDPAATADSPPMKGKGPAPEAPPKGSEAAAPPAKSPHVEVDIEAGDTLLPGLNAAENLRRWGFIQKVYGIVGAQLALTAAVGSVFALVPSLQFYALTSPWFFPVAVLSPLVLLIPLWFYRHSHPTNLALLALWTASLGITTGLACSTYPAATVAEALALTALVVLSLTAYTFHAVKKGLDFSYMGPMLYAALITMVVWSLVQIFFPMGDILTSIFCLIGALLFSLYIIYDTESLIKRFSYDEFVWASVNLYLDILNLFLYILRLLNRFR